MDYQVQYQNTDRHLMPDIGRAIALIGIAVVNVSVISYPIMGGYPDSALNAPVDIAGYFVVKALFLMKFYTIFSFFFGVGFAYQMRAAEKRHAMFAPQYYRRMFGLLILGLMNIAFLFQGDILVMYALLGSVLFLFRYSSTKTLLRTGLAFYFLQLSIFTAITVFVFSGDPSAPDQTAQMTEAVDRAHAVYGAGSFSDSIILRLQEWSGIIGIGLLLDGTGAMAFFLFGFAAVKSGVISNPNAAIWQQSRRLFLPLGLGGSILAAYVNSLGKGMMDPYGMLGMTLIALFSLFLSLGYLGLIMKWASGPMNSFKAFLARAGTASLTAYLLQGLIMSLIFNNYGMGYFAKWDAIYCILAAVVASVLSLCFASLWRRKFALGPFEYLLRRFTYFGADSDV